MVSSSLVAYLHYLGFMLSFAALTVEVFHLKPKMSFDELRKVVFADAAYGIAATAILVTGILRVIYFGKGSDYYLHNPFFHIKMGIFILVSLLSLYPTYTFLTWIKYVRDRQGHSLEDAQFNRLSLFIKSEIFAFTLLPLFAAIMTRVSSWG